MLTIKLPWPPKELNPNARLHHMQKARHVKSYKQECWGEAISWGANRFKADAPNVSITFYPPDKRRRDADNMVAAFKAGQDGLSQAIGIDDAKWSVSYHFPRETGGFVIVELTSGDAVK